MTAESEINKLAQELSSSPDDIVKLNALAYALLKIGKTAEAIPHLDKALKLAPSDLATLWHASVAALKTGQLEKALRLLYEVLRIKPDHQEAREKIRFLHRQMVPAWHFSMLNDSARNLAFEAAINEKVKPGMTVVEIGTGSGLLAMMAARAGAKHVYTIEKSFPLFNVARQIIERNGFRDKITVINKWSGEVVVGRDIPKKGELLIAEIFGSGLLDEQAIHFLNDARKRLLVPGGSIIPERATLMGAFFESKALQSKLRVDSACNFNLSLFNALYDEPSIQVDLSAIPHKLLSEPFKVFSFDFNSEIPERREDQFAVTAISTGICHGAAQWVQLNTSSSHIVDSDPRGPGSHWQQTIEVFDKTVNIKSGAEMKFHAIQLLDRISLRINAS